MNVICIKSNSKLIKGATYKVVMLNNANGKGYSFFRPTVRIYLNDETVQTFPLSVFKPEGADSFPQIQWVCPDYQLRVAELQQTKITADSIKSGDYVVPLFDHLKTLIKGKKYKITDVRKIGSKSSSWVNIKLQLEGSSRYYAVWNFRKCTSQEAREIGLHQIFDEKTNTETVNKHARKFDYYELNEKIKILLQSISLSTNDRFRHQMDIIDWAISKTSQNYKLKREDFDIVMNLSLSEILEILK